jgi:uncharacterized membrane protein
MFALEVCLSVIALSGLLLGMWSVNWARCDRDERRTRLGQRLFVGTMVVFAVTILLAALTRADKLTSLSLIGGCLLVAMLWETPAALREKAS